MAAKTSAERQRARRTRLRDQGLSSRGKPLKDDRDLRLEDLTVTQLRTLRDDINRLIK